jgi:DnaJ-class molecular chaperone
MAFDPYRILGIERDASEDEIRQVYRALARRYHPDLNKSPDAEALFKDLGQAFAILTDAKKRELFDRYGEASLQVGFDAGSQEHTNEHGRQADPWRAPRRPPEPRRPPRSRWEEARTEPRQAGRAPPDDNLDVVAPLEVELVTAITGGDVRAASPLTGAPLSVNIPPNAESGDQICLQGRGRPGRGGRQPGDLYFAIEIMPHPFFHRESRDLVLELPLTIEEAYYGARIQIPTLDGWIRVRIPPQSRGGERLRLKGQGIIDARGERGDMFVHLCIRLPDRLDALGRSLDRVGSLYTEPVRAGLRL